MSSPTKILIVEDTKYDYDLLLRELNKSELDFISELVETREGFEQALACFKPDIILSDYKLPSFDGISAFQIKQNTCPDIPFILISGTLGEEKAVELIKDGLTDYALKDKLFTVPLKIRRALKEAGENQRKIIAEQMLIKSEKQLAKAQEIAHLGNWEVDMASGVASASDEACRIFGVKPNEETNQYDRDKLIETWVAHIHPEDRESSIKKMTESEVMLQDVTFHHRIINNEGEIRHVRMERKFEFDSSGVALRRFGIVQDITYIKLAEELLRKSEENLRAIFDTTSTGFLLIDINYKIVSFNKEMNHFAEKSLGFSLKEEVGLKSLMLPEMYNNFRERFNKALNGGIINYEINYPPSKEYDNWYKIKANPVVNLEGNVTGICIALDNVSARKKTQQKFEQQYKELQKTNSELDRFVYSASHDLRAPLKSMLGLINISKESTESENTEQHELMDMLNYSVLKLDNFIEDILHYSRNRRMEVVKEEIDFDETIQDILQRHRFMEGAERLNFKIEINEQRKLVSDRRRVNVVLNNLISNAIKYSDKTKKNPVINIVVECYNDQAIIAVEDNGVGIAEKDHQKVFEMFYRASKLSTSSGLGLYIVKETLNKLGGSIIVESELNKGSKFIAKIPNSIIK